MNENALSAQKILELLTLSRNETIAGFEKTELDGSVSVGMSAYGNFQVTQAALQSLFLSAKGDYELILVDDCSPEGHIRTLFSAVKEVHPHTKLFFFEKNMEYSGSLNAIISHSSGERVLFLSNDIFVTPYYLSELLAISNLVPNVGIVRGCSNFVDNGLRSHNIDVPAIMDDHAQLFGFGKKVANQHHLKYMIDDFLTGDAFMILRSLINKIGSLDSLFYGYFADHDFGIRARIAKFKLILAQGAFAYHARSANFEYLPDVDRKKKYDQRIMRVYENWARFKLKYKLPIELPYTSVLDIPWEKLSSQSFDDKQHFSILGRYSED